MRLAKMLLPPATPDTDVVADVPAKYIDFLSWMSVTPHPGQAELARVAYDGDPPEDVELARRIFGDIAFDKLTPAQRAVVCEVVGGRGGKTYLLIALRLVWGMLVRDLSSVAPGQQPVALVIAPNDDLRQECVNYAIGAVRSKAELRPLLRLPRGTREEDTVSSFGLYRADFERIVKFESGVATRGGYGGRGRSLTDVALDECAFFRDATYKVNDKDIFAAASPRVLPGGQSIIASTPWAETGLLHETYERNFGKLGGDALVAQAPTLTLHDSPMTRAIVTREQARDPENADREFGAKFMRGGTVVFFDSALITAALTDEPFALAPGDVVGAGGDFGFRSNSSALMLSALRGRDVHLFLARELRPEPGQPLKPSVTVAEFARLIEGRTTSLVADQHYRESIDEHLQDNGLFYIPAPASPADTYVRARTLLREGRVKIHLVEGRDRLVQQLKEVQGRPLPGGGMSILHPRWARGEHGDLAAAFVLALWQVAGDVVEEPPPEPGTREAEEAAKRARAEHYRQEEERPYWQARGGAADRGRDAHWRGPKLWQRGHRG